MKRVATPERAIVVNDDADLVGAISEYGSLKKFASNGQREASAGILTKSAPGLASAVGTLASLWLNVGASGKKP